MQSDEDEHTIFTQPNLLGNVAQELRAQGLAIQSEKFTSLPQTTVTIDDINIARQVLKLYDILDAYDDTLNVFTNFTVSDTILGELNS